MRRNFGGKIYTAYYHAHDKKEANTKAKEFREQGLQIRVTKDPGGGYLLWKRGERKPEIEKGLRKQYKLYKKRGLV